MIFVTMSMLSCGVKIYIYNAERNILRGKMFELEREWSLQGLPGNGVCEKTRESSR